MLESTATKRWDYRGQVDSRWWQETEKSQECSAKHLHNQKGKKKGKRVVLQIAAIALSFCAVPKLCNVSLLAGSKEERRKTPEVSREAAGCSECSQVSSVSNLLPSSTTQGPQNHTHPQIYHSGSRFNYSVHICSFHSFTTETIITLVTAKFTRDFFCQWPLFSDTTLTLWQTNVSLYLSCVKWSLNNVMYCCIETPSSLITQTDI